MANNEDFYLQVAKQRLDTIECNRTAYLSDLQGYRMQGDKDGAESALQQLANLEAERQNVTALVNQYIQSQAPPPELTQEERAAKPIEKMDYNDVYQMMKRDSRYGVDEDAFRRGVQEVARRRARGE